MTPPLLIAAPSSEQIANPHHKMTTQGVSLNLFVGHMDVHGHSHKLFV